MSEYPGGYSTPGAGGLYPNDECGRRALHSARHHLIMVCASFSEGRTSSLDLVFENYFQTGFLEARG
jgi:hypothetical protein